MVPNMAPLVEFITITRSQLLPVGPTFRNNLLLSPLTVEILHPLGSDKLTSPKPLGLNNLFCLA